MGRSFHSSHCPSPLQPPPSASSLDPTPQGDGHFDDHDLSNTLSQLTEDLSLLSTERSTFKRLALTYQKSIVTLGDESTTPREDCALTDFGRRDGCPNPIPYSPPSQLRRMYRWGWEKVIHTIGFPDSFRLLEQESFGIRPQASGVGLQ